jgi:cysteine desulfuration protein SufE
MNKIEQRVQYYRDTLAMLPDTTDRYRFLIDLGRRAQPFPEDYRLDAFKVQGCLSQVWLVPQLIDGVLHYHSDSDAAIVKGTVTLVADCYSGNTAEDIVNSTVDLYQELGLENLLSVNRRNGAYNMLKMIRTHAELFKEHTHETV